MTMDTKTGNAEATSGSEPERIIDLNAGRRAFLKYSGLAAASASLFAAPGMTGAAQAQTANIDVQILNFALNLEYLEAEFYLHAAFGRGLNDADITGLGTPGEVLAGGQVPFTNPLVAAYANEIANDEETHVKFLRSALGDSKVARPKINVKGAFTKAAQAAGVIGPNDTFDAYANDDNFVLAAYIFEDVGVTAYHGAAALITNKDYLTAAAGILAVEAYHAGLIRTLLFAQGQSTTAFKNTRLISALRSTLAGANPPDDQGVGMKESTISGGPSTLSNIVPTDTNSLAFARTPQQVLNIVYGAQNATGGLFFPNGINSGPAG